MFMKFAVPVLVLGCASAMFATDTPETTPAAPPRTVVEQIVAKVNNEIVTRGDLERARHQLETELKRQNLAADKADELLKQAERDVLRDKIDQLLLVQKAKELSINVDTELAKYIGEIQVQNKFTDPDKFQTFVREQLGVPYEDWKQQVKDSMLTQRVIRQEVGSKITIPQSELRKYYDEHKNEFVREEQVLLREIFLSTTGKNEQAVAAIEKKAKDIVARARKGENFGNLARDNSDATTAQNQGELGAFKRGELKKDIEDVVFQQTRGYVSDPLKQPNGLEILKVEEHYAPGLQPFEAVENEIMDKMYSPRMQPAVRQYLTKLRQDAFLEIREGYADSGAAPGKDTRWHDPAQFKPVTVTKEEVAAQPRRKRLLGIVPIPGTRTTAKSKTAPASAPSTAPASVPGPSAAGSGSAPAPAPNSASNAVPVPVQAVK